MPRRIAIALVTAGLIGGMVAGAAGEPRTLRIEVLDEATGKPLPARLEIRVNTRTWNEDAGEDGKALVQFDEPELQGILVAARLDGYVPMARVWEQRKDPTPPETIRMVLEKGTTIGGLVQSEAGQPIEGAAVAVSLSGPPDEHGQQVYLRDAAVQTDAQGRWRFDLAPAKLDRVAIRAEHLDYASERYFRSDLPMEKLRDGSAVLVLKRGLKVIGHVLDQQGNPIRGAKISQGSDRFGMPQPPQTSTDLEGRFEFENVPPGELVLTVQAWQHAPDLRQIEVTENMVPIEFRLEPGKTVRGRVVDTEGKPIAGVTVIADTWRSHRSLHFRATTDDQGRFVWDEAPADEVLYHVISRDYAYNRNLRLTPSEQEHQITLKRPTRVVGRVTDARTGEPIRQFTAVPGIWLSNQRSHWDNDRRQIIGRHGAFEFAITEPREGHVFRVEADGYLPQISEVVSADREQAELTFRLEPGGNIEGLLVQPGGQPVAGADVYLVLGGNWISIEAGKLNPSQLRDVTRCTTDAQGRFTFKPQAEPFTLLAVLDTGIAWATREDFARSKNLVVQPWGRLEGVLRVGTTLGANQKVIADGIVGRPGVRHHSTAVTDDQGRFVLNHIVPGEVRVVRVIPRDGGGEHYAHQTKAFVQPGQVAAVDLGGKGRPVVGRVRVPEQIRNVADAKPLALVSTKVDLPRTDMPDELYELPLSQRGAWLDKWQQSPEGKAVQEARAKALSASVNYSVDLKPDGTFRVDDVPTGRYVLTISYNKPPTPPQNQYEMIGRAMHEFVVPEMPGGRSDEPLELPPIEVKPVPRAAVGDEAPPIRAKKLDGGDFDLAALRGRHVLLHFWAVYTQEFNEFDTLQQIAAQFRGDDRLIIIGLNIDPRISLPKRFLAIRKVDWPHVFMGDPDGITALQDYSNRKIPSVWLIGPDGRIVARDLTGRAIRSAVNDAMNR